MNNKTEKFATIVISDIPDRDGKGKKSLGIYKFRLNICLITMFTFLKPGGSMMLFFNPEYKSWIVAVLKKFELMKYKGIVYNKGKLGDKNLDRYDFCYRLYKKPSVLDKTKPRDHEIESIKGAGFIESLILNYSNEGDLVCDCIDHQNEIQSLCQKNGRLYTNMND